MHASHLVLILFVISIAIQTFLYYVGCRNQCIIPNHGLFKSILIINRIVSYVLYLVWIKLYFGQIFGSRTWILIVAAIVYLLGQGLTASAFNTLTIDGIYYGMEYGKIDKLRIDNVFPFNIRYLNHPMYVGCMLIATAMFLATGFSGTKLRTPVALVYVYIVAMFVVAMYIEDTCSNTCPKATTGKN